MGHRFFLVTFLLISVFLNSCSVNRPAGKTEAEVLYREAKKLVDNGRYLLAIEKLNLIRSKYPYSYYSTHAELLSADVLFAQENYVEAAAAYIVFKDFHPKNKRLGYVIWKIGESFFKQLPSTFDRDLTSGLEAIRYYKELLRIFPNSEHREDAEKRIAYCEGQIQKKEQYVADFYFKTKVYDAARFRYLNILKGFEKRELRDHSIVRIIQASAKLNEKEKCATYYKEYAQEISEKSSESLSSAYQSCENLK